MEARLRMPACPNCHSEIELVNLKRKIRRPRDLLLPRYSGCCPHCDVLLVPKRNDKLTLPFISLFIGFLASLPFVVALLSKTTMERQEITAIVVGLVVLVCCCLLFPFWVYYLSREFEILNEQRYFKHLIAPEDRVASLLIALAFLALYGWFVWASRHLIAR